MSKIVRKIISTPLAPRPVAPYNQAVVIDSTVYVSGCVGLDLNTSKLVEGGAAAEANQALVNLQHVLEAAGSSLRNVVKTTVLLNDMNDFVAINEVYKQFFVEPFPARTAFQAAKLPLGAMVEIDAIAVVGDITDQAGPCKC